MYKMINFSILKVLFWGCVLIYLIIYMKKHYIRPKLNRGSLIFISLISSIHIIIYFYLGFTAGFSKSPYSHKIISILKNCIIEILPIIGIEVTRYVFVQKNSKSKTRIAIITTMLILSEINYYELVRAYNRREDLFEYIFGTLIPLMSSNSLYSYITLKESYSIVLIMRIQVKLSVLLLPIVTKINWFMIGTIELIYLMIVYLVFKYKNDKKENKKKYRKESKFSKVSNLLIIIICIIIVCFTLGLFKYKSITILSNSMQPTFGKADVVIYKKLDEKELKNLPINAIIIYKIESQYIAHRIVSKVKDGEEIKYQTQGDSNNMSDVELVGIDQIEGVYNFHIKYIGMPSVLLYKFFNMESSKVEIK